MTTPPTTHRFWNRAALRRYALLNELTLACGSGEVPLDYKHDDDGSDQSASSLKPVLPVPADDDVAYRFIAPEVLHEIASHRYTAFWWNIKHLETAHRDICLVAFKATLDATMADERPEEIEGLGGLLSSAGTLLTQWKLVNETGQGPLTGPFTAALIQGVHHRAPRPNLFGPLLVPVPNIGSGDVLTVLTIGHRLRSGVPLARIAVDLGLSLPKSGSGRFTNQVQLIDAQIWVLRRIGDVPVAPLAQWQGVNHQRIERIIEGIDSSLENGLPRRRSIDPFSTPSDHKVN